MRKLFPYIVLLASLSLAISAAYYSVFGLSKLFSSQAQAVIILAGTLEASKLIAASYLHRYWYDISTLIKTYLITAVIVLMCITSLGIYGFLVSAYQDTAYKLENLELEVSNIENKKQNVTNQLTSVVSEKKIVNDNVIQLTQALSNNRIQYTDRKGNVVIRTSNENRKAYEKQLNQSASRLTELNKREIQLSDSISRLDLSITDLKSNSQVTSEVGPLKYIASITGVSMDIVVNWLIIALILVFDPLAIILLISANKALQTKFLQAEKSRDNEESQAERVKAPTQSLDDKLEQPIIVSKISSEPKSKNTNVLSYWKKLRNERNEKNK